MVAVVAIVVFMAVSSEDNTQGETDYFKHIKALKEELSSSVVWKDFLSREGGICIVVVTLFLLARKANNFFDAIEEEMKEKKRQEKKNADRVKKGGLDKVNEEEEGAEKAKKQEN